jgi:hypothetical protein
MQPPNRDRKDVPGVVQGRDGVLHGVEVPALLGVHLGAKALSQLAQADDAGVDVLQLDHVSLSRQDGCSVAWRGREQQVGRCARRTATR